MALYPLLFKPIFKERIWGGQKINTVLDKEIPSGNIGESWEISDRTEAQSVVINGSLQGKTLQNIREEFKDKLIGKKLDYTKAFPLLVKILDAKEDLSLQLHPTKNDIKFLKDASPKSEFWYVLDKDMDSKIIVGLKNDDKGGFINNINKPEIRSFVNEINTNKNTFIYVPSGVIHAIGKGNLILEVQQNSDTTYRVSDWGRLDPKTNQPRELHIKEAMLCLDFYNKQKLVPQSINKVKTITILENDLFKVQNIYINKLTSLSTTEDYCNILSVTDGDVKISYNNEDIIVKRGCSCLIPAGISYTINPIDIRASMLLTTPLQDIV